MRELLEIETTYLLFTSVQRMTKLSKMSFFVKKQIDTTLLTEILCM